MLYTAETWGQSGPKENMTTQGVTLWASQASCHHFLVLLSLLAQGRRGPEQAVYVLQGW